MTGLEMTKLCAEAMGLTWDRPAALVNGEVALHYVRNAAGEHLVYNPLHDDAQAMALVKKFKLHLFTNADGDRETWVCLDDFNNSNFGNNDNDLNRSIVECVAKMQAAKVTT